MASLPKIYMVWADPVSDFPTLNSRFENSRLAVCTRLKEVVFPALQEIFESMGDRLGSEKFICMAIQGRLPSAIRCKSYKEHER